jgi:hypothetical protein
MKIGVHVKFGVYEYDGEFYAWYVLEDESPRLSQPFATREEAKAHNVAAAARMQETLAAKGLASKILDKGSREQN